MDGIQFEVIVDIRWEPLERRYVARCEEYPDLMGLGPTPMDAGNELRELIQRWMINLARHGYAR